MVRLALLAAFVVTAACGGDDGAVSDASHDGPELDAQGFPPAPALGAPIDRMGRPAINTVLNSLFEPNATKKAAKRDAYNHAIDPDGWPMATLDSTAVPATRVLGEFSAYLGILDSVDTGHPDVPGAAVNGCGNAPAYAAPATSASYAALAGVLADDQLYVDTARSQCDRYLAVELNAVLTVPYTSCGGRTLTHDVIDSSYSLLFAGAGGFSSALAPRIGDGAGAHTDVNNLMFPFLGAPH
ncbi:MAG: hypothetical protein H0T42_23425 [Deltaproteobacteria bacterium]|nr:hypothetical protein [Deltaproteobacteria bacterium]